MYHLQGLWLKGRLKMHFIQIACVTDRLGQGRIQTFATTASNEGFGAEATMGSRGKVPGQGSEGRSRPNADDIFLFQRPIS